jgi:hypothetical protein
MSATDNNIEKAKMKFENINQWISNCDTKSSFLLTLYGVLLTIVFTSNIIEKIDTTLSFKPSFSNIGWTSVLNLISLLSLLAFIFFSIKCLFYIYNTLKARIDDKIYTQEELNTNSNIFFQTITSKTYKEFKNNSNSETNEEFLNDLNSQLFINANIASEKFQAYNKSLFNAFMGLIFLGIYLLTT